MNTQREAQEDQRTSASGQGVHLHVEFARHRYDTQQGIIRQLDTKAGILITLLVFLVTEAIPLAKDVAGKLQWTGRGAFSSWLYVVSAILLATGFVSTAICVQRVIRSRRSEHASNSVGLMFADDVLKRENPEEYHKAVMRESEAALLKDLNSEIFQLSAIIKRKTDALRIAWQPTLISFIAWGVNALISVFILSWK